MTEGMAARQEPPGNRSNAFMYIVRYGLSIIRQEGWGYFFQRLARYITIQLQRIFHSLTGRNAARLDGRMLDIPDVETADPLQPIQYLGSQPAGVTRPQQTEAESISNRPLDDRLIQPGIIAHDQNVAERLACIQQGAQFYKGRRLLFVSPIGVLGGGANSIFLAAMAMRRMGVDAQLLNLNVHRQWFEKNYPSFPVPVIFSELEDIPKLAANFEAVVATSNPTVSWIAPLATQNAGVKLGYYLQDYEPYFYNEGSHEYQRATASFTLIPGLVRMATTPWIAEQVERHHGVGSILIGAHIDTDLFHTRKHPGPSWPGRPLRIVAMIRPSTPRRSPQLTMEVLQQVSKQFSSKVETWLFGCDLDELGFAQLDLDFDWKLAGQLRSTQVASLFNQADIFVDFSAYQGFGLTAVEAMGSGLAVIVPAEGGTGVYAKHEETCLVVDTGDQAACLTALQRLVEDDALRSRLQENAIATSARFYPEQPALNMLNALFGSAQ